MNLFTREEDTAVAVAVADMRRLGLRLTLESYLASGLWLARFSDGQGRGARAQAARPARAILRAARLATVRWRVEPA